MAGATAGSSGVQGGRVTLTAWQYGWSRERGKNYLDFSLFLVPNLSVTPWPNLMSSQRSAEATLKMQSKDFCPWATEPGRGRVCWEWGQYRIISKWFSATCVCACPQHHFCSLPINSKACFVSVYIFH